MLVDVAKELIKGHIGIHRLSISCCDQCSTHPRKSALPSGYLFYGIYFTVPLTCLGGLKDAHRQL